ncbi:TonB-dependent receptor [marine bacterium AO1-C]|nr:TonB-dependent receptor [marine bacterium AO1-C]
MIRNYTIKFFTLMLLMSWAFIAQAQTAINGKVTDDETGEGLAGVSVYVKGTTQGTVTDANGSFALNVTLKKPFTLTFSMIGFATKDMLVDEKTNLSNLTIKMGQTAVTLESVVVSASRRAEKITEAPATISIINSKNIAELPSFNVGELIARQKGVDYVRSGVLGTGVNVRGFNSAFNPKNLQMNDGRLSTLIATGLPFGPLGTVVKEDIERIEVILGPSAALYGPNAHNGLVNTITKDPRTSQGTTFALGAGNQSVFSGRLRHATKINDKFAFKISGEYTQGEEFDYVDSVYIGGTAFDEYLLDRKFDALRGEAALYYSPTDNSDIIFSYGYSNSNNLAQTNAGRNQIKDWSVQYFHLRYTSPRLFAQAYYTMSKTDETYAINQRTQNYQSFILAGFSEDEARRRSLTEAWAGVSPTVGVALNRGALFRDDSKRINGEIQYNNDFGVSGMNVIVGAQYQLDMANSLGTYLLDNNGEGIDVGQIGVYAQFEKSLGNGFKTVLAARADNHDLYGFNFVPKAALLKIGKKGTWRLTYGQGIAAPTILNLEGDIFGGLLLGNGQGFTLSNGTKIEKLKVETIQTIELGYKGKLTDKLYLDANVYYNISRDFLSPAINIADPANGVLVTQRGDQPLSQLQPGIATDAGSPIVLTYVNFGNVTTFGFDAGINYYINKAFNVAVNYSYFGFQLDENDLKNDGNKNGVVEATDLPINTPEHKLSLGLNYSSGKLFGSIFTRYVHAYNFFSGINVASKTNNDLTVGGDPVVENARVGRTWNYGPLGGFVNIDLSLGYHINKMFTISGQVTNLFDSEVREFVASPSIGRLFSIELKVNLPAFK